MKSALLVIDVQQSFTRRPYWNDAELPGSVQSLQQLREPGPPGGPAGAAGVPCGRRGRGKRVFLRVRLDQDLAAARYPPDRSVHQGGALGHVRDHRRNGQSLDYWLRNHGVERLIVTGIRTEQCCETTTRHASDLGYSVSYAMDATLDFPHGVRIGPHLHRRRRFATRTELVLQGRFAQVQPSASRGDLTRLWSK